MDSYKLLGFVGILREALNIFFRNGKLMASLTIPTLFIYSLILLSNFFSTKPLIIDLLVKESSLLVISPANSSSSSSEFANLLFGIKDDLRIIVGVQSTFGFAYFIISLFFATATIFASAITYSGKNLSLKELLMRVVRSLIRPFVTQFYVILFKVGYYTFLVLAILIPLVAILGLPVTSINAAFIKLAIPATVFYLYLAVVWTLGLVVSVIEEGCYGIEALGKAGRLVKGRKLHGFGLNILFMLLSLVVIQGFKIISIKQSLATQIIMGLLVINSLFLVVMFNMMAYTVLYYQCKKIHGEEIELQGSIEYSKIPSTPLVISEDIP